MNEIFEVGEIAIMVSMCVWPEYNGCECEIIGPLQLREFWGDRAHTFSKSGICYRARTVDGRTVAVAPKNLRKKRLPPPREELGDWELIPWQRPTAVKA